MVQSVKHHGFTLVEMVITIVVVAIIFLGLAGFVELGTRGYVDTIDRQRLQNQARFAIEKLTRELSHAVPNSIQTRDGGKCIEFYPIRYAGFYSRREFDGEIDFAVGNEDFSHDYTFADDMRLVINPSRREDLESGSQTVSLKGISSSESGPYFSVSMAPDSDSVANRHYIYQDRVISYCITPENSLMRDGGVASQLPVIVASGLVRDRSGFEFEQTQLQRGGLVHLELLFINGDEQSQYQHDVQVINVP